jgi:hypothetical protein
VEERQSSDLKKICNNTFNCSVFSYPKEHFKMEGGVLEVDLEEIEVIDKNHVVVEVKVVVVDVL